MVYLAGKVKQFLNMDFARFDIKRLLNQLSGKSQSSKEKPAALRKHMSYSKALHPIILEFQALVEGNAEFYMLANQMLEQVPLVIPFTKDPHGRPQVRDFPALLRLFDAAMTTAPEYTAPHLMMIGLLFSTVINWAIGTKAGAAFLLNKEVNAPLQQILKEWTNYFGSEDLIYVLIQLAHGLVLRHCGEQNAVQSSGYTETLL